MDEFNLIKNEEQREYFRKGFNAAWSLATIIDEMNRSSLLKENEKRDHDGCVGCKHELKAAEEEPCRSCKQAYSDKYAVAE